MYDKLCLLESKLECCRPYRLLGVLARLSGQQWPGVKLSRCGAFNLLPLPGKARDPIPGILPDVPVKLFDSAGPAATPSSGWAIN